MKDKIQFPGSQPPRAPGLVGSLPPIPQGGIDLSQPAVKIARIYPRDMIEERELHGDGRARFFVGRDDEWGKLSKDRDVTAITLLAAGDEEGTVWVPLVGARVVLRLRMEDGKEDEMLDLMTTGSGTTAHLPARVAPVPTVLGSLLHCPIMAGWQFRIEVEAPGMGGARVRCCVHGIQCEKV